MILIDATKKYHLMFYQMILGAENTFMDMTLLRQTNLQKLIDEFPHSPGNRAAFCRHYGLDALQIGQYFTESKNGRNIGERKAQSIEKAVGLAPGWLSQQHDSNAYDGVKATTPDSVMQESHHEYHSTASMQLMWATPEEAAILTQYRLATTESQKMMANFADTLIKDPEKLKKLIKLAV